MAALTKDRALRFKGEPKTERFIMNTSAAFHAYKGNPMVIDINVDNTYVVPYHTVAVADNDIFVGIAAEEKSVASGDPETTEIEVYVWPSIIGFKDATPVFTNNDLGGYVWLDGDTLAIANGTYPRIGTLYKIEDGYAFVRIDSPIDIDVP